MKNLHRLFLFLVLFSFYATNAFSKSACERKMVVGIKLPGDTVAHDSVEVTVVNDSLQQVQVFSETDKHKQRLVAAVLAFPFPFGMLGLHRIYLGTDPWVPVVYIITFGGGFGILPMIDFFEIIFSTDEQLESYEHNPKIFMWVK